MVDESHQHPMLDIVFLDVGDPPLLKVPPASVEETMTVRVAVLQSGLLSGKPSLMFDFTLDGDRHVLWQTSYAILDALLAATRGRYPEVSDGQ